MVKSILIPLAAASALAAGWLSRLAAEPAAARLLHAGPPPGALREVLGDVEAALPDGARAALAGRAPDRVQILPFGLMGEVRRAEGRAPMQVQLYHPGSGAVALEELIVRAPAGGELARVELLGERLAGDGGRMREVYLAMELVDPDLTHRHRNRLFVPLEERPALAPETDARLLEDILRGVAALKREGAPQLRNVTFEVDLARLFGPGAAPGDEALLELELRYRRAGAPEVALRAHAVRLLPAFLPPPPGWSAAAPGAWLRGDLHVHNCRDQAVSGCPDCAAESFNTTGSFTNAQLRDQFVALGFDFFSTTTHSYCINSDTEFQAVQQEAAALDLPDFQVLCGTEVTGRETGRQTGGDSADWMCELGGGEPVHHMGAHGLAHRIRGGGDGFLDLCDAPIHGVNQNSKEVSADGGFSVANHPGDDYFAFNSTGDLRGVEAGQVYGVEIWNGSTSTNAAQNYHVAWWQDRLKEGRILYAYSGSDTHDAAYDFGATHVWVEGALGDASLLAGLRSGRCFVSNGPFLSIQLEDPGSGRRLEMGGILRVPAGRIPPGASVQVHVDHNTGPAPARVRVFRGQVGGGESLVAEWTNVTGAGRLTATAPVSSTASSWYRAELARNDNSQSAFTSPAFVRLF